ncbi:unnamed protein product [Microthlaspi erraticum]|uniref:Uncharacterized protein n=1 Tax=Microthlaspi erraticum TaxID=1685480 RepID=A0A6D2I1E3_9BRAS|nr:unnamed protein product [Microthlaspi erraticum]
MRLAEWNSGSNPLYDVLFLPKKIERRDIKSKEKLARAKESEEIKSKEPSSLKTIEVLSHLKTNEDEKLNGGKLLASINDNSIFCLIQCFAYWFGVLLREESLSYEVGLGDSIVCSKSNVGMGESMIFNISASWSKIASLSDSPVGEFNNSA